MPGRCDTNRRRSGLGRHRVELIGAHPASISDVSAADRADSDLLEGFRAV